MAEGEKRIVRSANQLPHLRTCMDFNKGFLTCARLNANVVPDSSCFGFLNVWRVRSVHNKAFVRETTSKFLLELVLLEDGW